MIKVFFVFLFYNTMEPLDTDFIRGHSLLGVEGGGDVV